MGKTAQAAALAMGKQFLPSREQIYSVGTRGNQALSPSHSHRINFFRCPLQGVEGGKEELSPIHCTNRMAIHKCKMLSIDLETERVPSMMGESHSHSHADIWRLKGRSLAMESEERGEGWL